ncbi:hypothetical protein KG383_005179 [Salmonella enterica subsp. enterica serovar Newport]|nr:hypothetical protein [Salmonella enterica subsp. enterica serovar Newport]
MKITNDAQFSAAYDLTHALSQSAGRIKYGSESLKVEKARVAYYYPDVFNALTLGNVTRKAEFVKRITAHVAEVDSAIAHYRKTR